MGGGPAGPIFPGWGRTMIDTAINFVGTQVERPVCPRCHRAMKFSHIEPSLEGVRDLLLYRCDCGEQLGKVSIPRG